MYINRFLSIPNKHEHQPDELTRSRRPLINKDGMQMWFFGEGEKCPNPKRGSGSGSGSSTKTQRNRSDTITSFTSNHATDPNDHLLRLYGLKIFMIHDGLRWCKIKWCARIVWKRIIRLRFHILSVNPFCIIFSATESKSLESEIQMMTIRFAAPEIVPSISSIYFLHGDENKCRWNSMYV